MFYNKSPSKIYKLYFQYSLVFTTIYLFNVDKRLQYYHQRLKAHESISNLHNAWINAHSNNNHRLLSSYINYMFTKHYTCKFLSLLNNNDDKMVSLAATAAATYIKLVSVCTFT